MWKQAEKKMCKRQQGTYHRLIRRKADEYVGLTDDTEPAAKKNSHRLNRCPGLNSVGSTSDRAPDDPTKSKCNAGAVVQRSVKTKRVEHRLNRRYGKSSRRLNGQNSKHHSNVG